MRTTGNWKNTDKKCYWYSSSAHYYAKVYNNSNYTIFSDYSWNLNKQYIYPKADLSNIEDTYKVTTLNPDSRLYFDQGSGFPRFKLGLTSQKRCIKQEKADYIVVSGSSDYDYTSDRYIAIEDNSNIYLIKEQEFKDEFHNNMNTFQKDLAPYITFTSPTIVYTGILYGYDKNSVYLAKYAEGEYTLDYITDIDLDKMINNLCPEPTYNELESVIDMLNSEDAATVQLGVKMIQGYNVDKYKMTLRLILCTRSNWYLFTKNTVGTKQLMETLGLDRYNIQDTFSYGCRYACVDGESYDVEDIALAKQLSVKMLTEYFQNLYKDNFLCNNWQWLPDQKRIKLE